MNSFISPRIKIYYQNSFSHTAISWCVRGDGTKICYNTIVIHLVKRYKVHNFLKDICLFLPRLVLFIDGAVTTFVRSVFFFFLSPRVTLTGQCKKRGVCCRNIAIHLPDDYWRHKKLKKAAILWYVHLYRFVLKYEDPSYNVLVFKCAHLHPDGYCTIHWRRPFLCRNYPRKHFFKSGTVLPGCGYRFIKH